MRILILFALALFDQFNSSAQFEPDPVYLYNVDDTAINSVIHYQADFLEWSLDEKNLEPYKNIERKGDSLVFHTSKAILVLVNEEYDEEKGNFEAPRYRFVNFYTNQNVAELKVYCYEYSYHLLVDMTSGGIIKSFGKPLFNNDNSLIFTSNVDLETHYTENGFQIIEKNNDGFKLIETILLDDWGIARASWIGKNRLLISKATIEEPYEMYFKPGVLTVNIEIMRR